MLTSKNPNHYIAIKYVLRIKVSYTCKSFVICFYKFIRKILSIFTTLIDRVTLNGTRILELFTLTKLYLFITYKAYPIFLQFID